MDKYTIDEKKKDEILYHAERTLYFNNMLIKQCESWISAEEGNANMMKSVMEKQKQATRISRRNKINRVLNFFGLKTNKEQTLVSVK